MFYFILFLADSTELALPNLGGLGQDTNLLTSARVSQILMPTLRSFVHYTRASAAHNLFIISVICHIGSLMFIINRICKLQVFVTHN